MSTPPQLVEHFFRREYGQLVATLCRRVGVRHLAAVEDAVSASLLTALEAWGRNGLPANPSAWLFRVASNELVGALRMQSRRGRLLSRALEAGDLGEDTLDEDIPPLEGEVADDLLRMLFVTCDDELTPDQRLALALKTLCGFSVREIAYRCFATEPSIYKRIGRARARLRHLGPDLNGLTAGQMTLRLPDVHAVIYAIFTEGHLSALPERTIRRELCDEAIRLGTVLVEHPVGDLPTTRALLALMHLHLARMVAREDPTIGLLLLEEQDRSQWDETHLAVGMRWLASSAEGERLSRYHLEAAIAAEHALAPNFAATRWERVAECYAQLELVAPSPIHRLNRALAIAQCRGPAAGLELLDAVTPPAWLAGSYLWAAGLADLHRRNGDLAVAERHRRSALELAPTPAVRVMLARRLGH